jgi:hypothetical protein
MGRCEGYYRLENRRCDRDAERRAQAADGELYQLCAYHTAQLWTTSVARWNGESDLRQSSPVELRTAPTRDQAFSWG